MANIFDIRRRTYLFAVDCAKFSFILMKNPETRVIAKQLLRSGTSVGANTEEADGSRSRKELCSKMTIARNEAKETGFWLKLILDTNVLHGKENIDKAHVLLSEVEELTRILSAIILKVENFL